MRKFVLAILALALVAADAPRTDADKKDAEALQGTWTMVSLTISGQNGSEEQVKGSKLVVEGDRFTPTVDDQAIPCTFKLDTSVSPKAIDITYKSGNLKDRTVKGSYKFEGDTFVMIRPLRPNDDRPVDFASGAESGLVLVVWKRAKP